MLFHYVTYCEWLESIRYNEYKIFGNLSIDQYSKFQETERIHKVLNNLQKEQNDYAANERALERLYANKY